MIIPYQELQPETLDAIIEDWLSREAQSWAFEQGGALALRLTVLDQLKSGQMFISWDDESQTLNLISKDELDKIEQ